MLIQHVLAWNLREENWLGSGEIIEVVVNYRVEGVSLMHRAVSGLNWALEHNSYVGLWNCEIDLARFYTKTPPSGYSQSQLSHRYSEYFKLFSCQYSANLPQAKIETSFGARCDRLKVMSTSKVAQMRHFSTQLNTLKAASCNCLENQRPRIEMVSRVKMTIQSLHTPKDYRQGT